MKKILLTIFITLFCAAISYRAFAFVRYEEKHPKKVTELYVTGYIDYAPFGFVDNPQGVVYGNFHTVFQPMIDDFIKDANLKMHYNLNRPNVDDLVQKVRQGEIDFMVGAYYQTEFFRGLELIYPAALSNPITVFMLPNRIDEIKSTDDLKKLKGVRNTNEIFSDFVERKVAELKPMEVDSSYQMFEKLFKKEADYIITSYYNGMLEAIKLGIRHQIAPAKQTLWNIPMFVGVSKTSRHREMISKYLTRYLNDKKNLDKLQQHLQEIIKQFESEYAGVVPPTFGLDKEEDSAKVSQPSAEVSEPNVKVEETKAENQDNTLDGK